MHAPRSTRPARALAGLLLAAGLALMGCGGADSSGSDKTARAEAGSQADAREGAPGGGAADGAGASAAPKAPANPNRIIRTASVSVRVKDVPKALEKARATAENAGGYVGSETTTADEGGRERTRVVLRVPVDKYEEVLADLEGAGTLLERTAKAQDVTDQVVDVESRIASQRASVARIRELMDRATRLSDVVTLEGELSARQADLESLLAQQATLKDRTSLATVTLSLSEKAVREPAEDDDPGFVDALAGGWDAFVTMLRWLMVALGAVLPFAVAAALLVLLWLRLVRPRLPRRPVPAPAPSAPSTLPAFRAAPERTGAESARAERTGGDGTREED
ncbi:DUF4349 domain-containing protein [Streptomyces sp. DH24]|uniref:DUF4349 domain-containing protein n=1 Tax=Streptomyces sp. DH24 TaxID=3040123 RepID=UPI0024413E8E|nr:DUF4349 domain-containing protein [Streptomyces sp. DH24]MDG9717886.1 DUF4349 domain-containing protein [Streptomyces sp. DH24]